MVRFRQKLDSCGKIYLPKILREAGFAPVVEIAPNSRVAVMYPPNTDPEEVLASVRIIVQEIEQTLRLRKVRKK